MGSNTSIDLSSQALKATSMIRTNICTYIFYTSYNFPVHTLVVFVFSRVSVREKERSVPVSSWDTQKIQLFDMLWSLDQVFHVEKNRLIRSPAAQFRRGDTQQYPVVMSFQVLSRQMDRRNRWLVDSYPLDCQRKL